MANITASDVAKLRKMTGAGMMDCKNALVAAGKLFAMMDNFQFDLRYTITSFEMVTVVSGDVSTKRSNSNKLTPDMSRLLTRASRGQKVYFENIKAVGPDGRKSLAPIMLKIQ